KKRQSLLIAVFYVLFLDRFFIIVIFFAFIFIVGRKLIFGIFFNIFSVFFNIVRVFFNIFSLDIYFYCLCVSIMLPFMHRCYFNNVRLITFNATYIDTVSLSRL